MQPDELVEGIRSGKRRALARAITLAESKRPDHREQALFVLESVLCDTGRAARVGVSGAPGVGKSTFIEALGHHLISLGHRVAVLAVDPSSARTGGSILGDKTRMGDLARHGSAFIRPSPSGGTLGGVARRTREAMLLCEAFGFDVVLIETVGTGQSETAVEDLVDTFLLLVQPGAGDDLQAIKRGVMELADVVLVSKADGELAAAARRAAAEYQHSLRLLRPKLHGWNAPVLTISAPTGVAIDEAWTLVLAHRDVLRSSGELEARRARQASAALWAEITEQLHEELQTDERLDGLLAELEADVARGRRSPGGAARLLRERRHHLEADGYQCS